MNVTKNADAVSPLVLPSATHAQVDPQTKSIFAGTGPDIQQAFDWLVSFLPKGEWESRKAAIEQYIEATEQPSADPTNLHRMIGPSDDQIAWYLYLVHTAQHEPHRTDYFQASKVMPVFKRLGEDLDKIKSIRGIELQAAKLLDAKQQHPDSVLFEMLIALLWAKNGWSDVSFIPTKKKQKRADIRASDGSEEWIIETKRLVTTPEYVIQERDKWLRMWGNLAPALVDGGHAVILNVVVHVELHTLPDTFLLDELSTKLKFVVTPCKLISNETWDVDVEFVDFDRIRDHLKQHHVKTQSRRFQEMVGGRWERGTGFTCVHSSDDVRIGGNRGMNSYVKSIDWAAGAFWRCDAERSIELKARGIEYHLINAIEQLPDSGKCVVHIGIDTPDGVAVEAERYMKIIGSMMNVDSKSKDLRFVYVNLYEYYWPSVGPWLIDETVYKFAADADEAEPISSQSAIAVEDEKGENQIHWLREAP